VPPGERTPPGLVLGVRLAPVGGEVDGGHQARHKGAAVERDNGQVGNGRALAELSGAALRISRGRRIQRAKPGSAGSFPRRC
jgi:hypothetical protein